MKNDLKQKIIEIAYVYFKNNRKTEKIKKNKFLITYLSDSLYHAEYNTKYRINSVVVDMQSAKIISEAGFERYDKKEKQNMYIVLYRYTESPTEERYNRTYQIFSIKQRKIILEDQNIISTTHVYDDKYLFIQTEKDKYLLSLNDFSIVLSGKEVELDFCFPVFVKIEKSNHLFSLYNIKTGKYLIENAAGITKSIIPQMLEIKKELASDVLSLYDPVSDIGLFKDHIVLKYANEYANPCICSTAESKEKLFIIQYYESFALLQYDEDAKKIVLLSDTIPGIYLDTYYDMFLYYETMKGVKNILYDNTKQFILDWEGDIKPLSEDTNVSYSTEDRQVIRPQKDAPFRLFDLFGKTGKLVKTEDVNI